VTRLFLRLIPALLFAVILSGRRSEAESAGVSEEGAVNTFVISGPKDVADLALRGGDFGSWNYGREIFLEAGYFVGLYDVHRGASLVRFNVTGIPANTVISAKFRLYRPRSIILRATRGSTSPARTIRAWRTRRISIPAGIQAAKGLS